MKLRWPFKFEPKSPGQLAEDHACRFLRSKGCKLVERNFQRKQGELDIIALEGATLCFIEVRARSEAGLVSPAESVDPAKLHRLKLAAEHYLAEHGLFDEITVRFDLVSVFFKPGTARVRRVELLKNLQLED